MRKVKTFNILYSFCCLHPRVWSLVFRYIINIRIKYVRNVVCQLEISKFFDGVKVCVCERNGNFNASVTIGNANSAHSCKYNQWTDSLNVWEEWGVQRIERASTWRCMWLTNLVPYQKKDDVWYICWHFHRWIACNTPSAATCSRNTRKHRFGLDVHSAAIWGEPDVSKTVNVPFTWLHIAKMFMWWLRKMCVHVVSTLTRPGMHEFFKTQETTSKF